ncbi:hypothetical protein DTO166G4_1395 [Paecilomyces variotii]|nr:hypothetical protein DTO166G4_1395 [Paecilomyces variotii]KAJ9242725.1 hypothetical protein DTO166G5_480 [Paecilomyces variotii]KAJ9258407.1 hypothetical protein DTO207G8_1582 [Paecilomyces variotii]KAJ9308772.1 hypothetical protein DTO217A2_1731 [Paecilomyces variotii]KAJ9364671.1 hypothetical protein DTO280E4_1451 [Paecilomyces variotii]
MRFAEDSAMGFWGRWIKPALVGNLNFPGNTHHRRKRAGFWSGAVDKSNRGQNGQPRPDPRFRAVGETQRRILMPTKPSDHRESRWWTARSGAQQPERISMFANDRDRFECPRSSRKSPSALTPPAKRHLARGSSDPPLSDHLGEISSGCL